MKQAISFFLLLSFSLLTFVCCGGATKHYDVVIEEAIEKEYPSGKGATNMLVDLSATFGVEWDSLIFVTAEVPTEIINYAVGQGFERGYNRLFLKKDGRIVFHDSIPYFDSSAWFDIAGQSVWFSSYGQKKDEDEHFFRTYYSIFTTPKFRVERTTSDCYTLYEHSEAEE